MEKSGDHIQHTKQIKFWIDAKSLHEVNIGNQISQLRKSKCLKDRRLRRDLIKMFKIMNNLDNCYRHNHFQITQNQV